MKKAKGKRDRDCRGLRPRNGRERTGGRGQGIGWRTREKAKCKKDRGQGIGVRGQRIKIAAGYALAMTEEGVGMTNGGRSGIATGRALATTEGGPLCQRGRAEIEMRLLSYVC